MNLIALSIPIFIAFMAVELVVSWLKRRKVYRFHDAMSDLSCGMSSEVTGIFMRGAAWGIYVWLYTNWRLTDLDDGWWVTWLVAMLGVDCAYYWWHRASHRINALWAAHVVHHQSEDYNLAVALRQAWFTRVTSWILAMPLAVLGIPPMVWAVNGALNTLYQFFIHTRLVGRLGPLEWVLNTPSHHRVHHGRDPEYIDKNYAGVLIIWDRMFGTFVPEKREPVYGTVEPLRNWSGIWANFDYWKKLFRKSLRATSVKDKLKCFWGPPEWDPVEGTLDIPEVDHELYEKFETPSDSWMSGYVFTQFLPAAFGVYLILMWEKSGDPRIVVGLAGLVLWTLANWGALFHARVWASSSEWARLVAMMGGLGLYAQSVHEPWVGYVGLAFGLLSAALFAQATRSAFGGGKPPPAVV